MIRFSKIFLAATLLIILAWLLPWTYSFFTATADKDPFSLYSPIIKDFIDITVDDKKNVIGIDSEGHQYTQAEVDSLLPFFYARQLMADGRLPDTICGVPVSMPEIQRTNFNFRSTPREINQNAVKLYPVLESMSKRVDMKMPDDMMRITDSGVEFIVEETNAVDAEKSRLFTEAFIAKGFQFPARYLSGNPTTRKEYDEGYLMIDNAGHLFHFKQTVGRPYVRAIDMPQGLVPEYVFITEFRSQETLGFIIGEDHSFNVLMSDYTVWPTEIKNFDPSVQAITIMGDMLDWTVRIESMESVDVYALSADNFKVLKHRTQKSEYPSVPGLTFTSPLDKFVKPRL
jgi:hypothetical protein